MNKERFDIHAAITSRIVAAIEQGAGDLVMPWRNAASTKAPINSNSRRAYRGVNVLSLWITAQACGYRSNEWATFKQWQERDACVRKGEKGTPIVFYKNLEIAQEQQPEGQGEESKTIPFARASWVFNAEQVEGVEIENTDAPEVPLFERLANVERVIAATGAVIEYGGTRACYRRAEDKILIPDPHLFQGTQTMSAQEGFHAVQLHELTHWSGAPHRLNREKGKKFADKPYAFEELIAELGAAFLCAELDVTDSTPPDHAQYIAQYLTILENDTRAIFTAATAATAAANYILGSSVEQRQEEVA